MGSGRGGGGVSVDVNDVNGEVKFFDNSKKMLGGGGRVGGGGGQCGCERRIEVFV